MLNKIEVNENQYHSMLGGSRILSIPSTLENSYKVGDVVILIELDHIYHLETNRRAQIEINNIRKTDSVLLVDFDLIGYNIGEELGPRSPGTLMQPCPCGAAYSGNFCGVCGKSKHDVTPGGHKADEGKLRFDLIPPEVEEAIAEIYTKGANKYGERNWEKGLKYMRVYAAVRRHLTSWVKGEDIDPESGEPHLAHAAANLQFLLAFHLRGREDLDDRSAKNR